MAALPPPIPAFKEAAKVAAKGTGKFRLGVVIAARYQDKSIRVAVNRAFLHLKYKKWVIKTKKYMVHDEKNECDVGDRVQIQMCAPHSKWKSWEIAQIVRKDPPSALIAQNPEYNSVPRELWEPRSEDPIRHKILPKRILVNGQVLKQTQEGAITDESNPLLQQVLREKRRQEKRALKEAKKLAEKEMQKTEDEAKLAKEKEEQRKKEQAEKIKNNPPKQTVQPSSQKQQTSIPNQPQKEKSSEKIQTKDKNPEKTPTKEKNSDPKGKV